MKPKNSKERRNSIIKFMVLFLFTVALIVTAFFFDFNRVPFKENAVLRERSASVEQERKFQENFSEGMKEVKSLIDSLDTPGQNLSHINSLINSKIIELEKSIPTEDSTYRYDMYKRISATYVQIQTMKGELKEFEGVDEKIDNFVSRIRELEGDLNAANRNLDAYRLSNN